jgi:hypothetical protein
VKTFATFESLKLERIEVALTVIAAVESREPSYPSSKLSSRRPSRLSGDGAS